MSNESPGQAINSVRATQRLPPHFFFLVSAVFHYLGPAFAVLLFHRIAPLGMAWIRIASAAVIFAFWRKPWRYFLTLGGAQQRTVLALGVVLAAMNSAFYEALARLPLATVSAIEFLGTIALAASGARTARNVAALLLAVAGVIVLTDVRLVGGALGYVFAFLNCGLFVFYVALGHRIASDGGAQGIDRLSAAMLVAMIAAMPFGIRQALPALTDLELLGAGVGVGVTSSVIPYVCDQLAMARLPRASFALLLALLPATAAVIGIGVLRQIPSIAEALGLLLVVGGVAVHRPTR